MNDKTVQKIRISTTWSMKRKKIKGYNLQIRRSLPSLCVKLPETSCFDKIFDGKVLRALRREVNTGEGLFCACLKFSLAHVHTLFREA